MTNSEKIRELIRVYKNVWKSTNMDICESLKGHWYFIQYDEEYEECECIREFKTAEELIQMFVYEMAQYMNYTIGNEPELPTYKHKNIADAFCDDEINIADAILELNQSLNAILASENCDEKLESFIHSMQALLKEVDV